MNIQNESFHHKTSRMRKNGNNNRFLRSDTKRQQRKSKETLSGKVHKLTLAARLQWENTLKVLKERIFEPNFFKFLNHILIHFFIFCSQQTSQIREATERDKPKLVELLGKEPYFPCGDQIFLVHLILCLLVYVLLK